MKLLLISLLAANIVAFVHLELCPDDNPLPDCIATDYESYENCLRAHRAHRAKRETTPCEILTCQKKYEECFHKCAGEPNCQAQCPQCPQIIQQVIQQPQQYYQYLEQPQQQPQVLYQPMVQNQPQGYRTILIDGQDGQPATEHKMEITGGHNITTVINLKNIVNNTNIVNVPTNINSTNVNNIHVHANFTKPDTLQTGGKFNLGYTPKGSCCLAVQPKTCRTSTTGPRCHHRRHKTCGSQCKSRVIHVQSRRTCQGQPGGCQRKISYVPQPPQERCVYINQWPHVSCGGQYQSSCDGCYDGYSQQGCSGCYNEAFDVGPLYRRGPVLRPFYRHEAPCQFRGGCDDSYDDYGYGYQDYGPTYRRPHSRPRYRPQYVPDYSDFGHTDYDDSYDYFEDDLNEVINTDNISKNINDTAVDEDDDWGVPTHKCKVTEEDGTIIIKNCTGRENNNPFAGSPTGSDSFNRNNRAARYYDDDDDDVDLVVPTIKCNVVEDDGTVTVKNCQGTPKLPLNIFKHNRAARYNHRRKRHNYYLPSSEKVQTKEIKEVAYPEDD